MKWRDAILQTKTKRRNISMRNLKTVIIAVASVAVIGFTINAFAHGGMGMGGNWGKNGQGWHHQGDYSPGYDDQMSKEQYQQLEQKREAFLKDTQELRTNLYEKERELQNELVKEEPDAAKASGLQKEISELQAQFDQKRIDNMVEMRKLNPNAGRGFMHGGSMMGYGPRGGGDCWR
jgi:Spy/CpxP family protein refolding chaperone